MKRCKLAMVLAAAILVAGCSTDVTGHATPSTDAATSANPGGDGLGVPKVAQPIDTARYEKQPCAALTAGQLSQLGITTQPKPDLANKLGPSCEWNAFDQAGFTIGATLLTVGSSLAKVYKQHDQGQWPFFKPVADVSGYPGVLLDSLDAQPKGKCQLVVAVRDDLVYSVQGDLDPDSTDYANPCSIVQKAAEMAVSTMKAGA
ncbi:DUF3558 domain-containing protein [Amycolatopsis sp. NPDC021455]|uniref:DUF3558 domain-containing protein n=1 Tax=Amycolatopsis sp. NPDC021455 TaxID=3154901 RepID=UPI0033FBD58C